MGSLALRDDEHTGMWKRPKRATPKGTGKEKLKLGDVGGKVPLSRTETQQNS